VIEAIASRRSIRAYTDEPVSEEALAQILKAARIAPSGNNTQPWHFIVIRSPEQRAAVAKVSHDQQWMNQAPVFVACVGDITCRIPGYDGPPIDEHTPTWELKQTIRDMGIATEHLVLEAENQGLATCWVAWFTQDEIRPVLGVPDHAFVVAVVTIGHAAKRPDAPHRRRELSAIVHDERW
jgi:nitroreductase